MVGCDWWNSVLIIPVRCSFRGPFSTVLLLCFLTVGIHASAISTITMRMVTRNQSTSSPDEDSSDLHLNWLHFETNNHTLYYFSAYRGEQKPTILRWFSWICTQIVHLSPAILKLRISGAPSHGPTSAKVMNDMLILNKAKSNDSCRATLEGKFTSTPNISRIEPGSPETPPPPHPPPNLSIWKVGVQRLLSWN